MPRHPPTLQLFTSALRADTPAKERANRDPVQSWQRRRRKLPKAAVS
jgi:hypothetical protein